MKRTIALALVGSFALIASSVVGPKHLAAQGLTVTGYADFEAFVSGIGSDDKEFFFDNHHVNLILLGQITGDLFAAAEIEYEHAGEEIALEYGYFGYTGLGDVRILAGKFIVPFGRFNRDLHPTPINKLIGRPHGFRDILPQTYNDVGLWITGGVAVDDDNRVVFDVFAVNGLLGEDGGGIRGFRDNDRERAEGGIDDNKAVGGRLGLELPYMGFDVGGSVYHGKYAESEAEEDLDLTLFGVDASYQRQGFVLRGEWVRASQDATGGDMTKSGGYVQASYLATPHVEPAIRYSARSMPGEEDDLSRVVAGFNFHIGAAAIVRVDYIFNMEQDGFETDNDAFAFQSNILF
ncbi:MAG: hypothetical protein ABFS34_08635 [Gemmatimonadota bacterium]